MELSAIIPHIEVLIFASEKPLTTLDIVELINNAFGFLEERITLDQVESCVEGIKEKYNSEFYPFEVKESGGGLQFLTKKDFHKTLAQLNGDKYLKRLSSAALESLAIIAYKQPITKGEIESIRGVNSDYSVQKLLEKELIVISGRNEKMPGQPLIYATSKTFMDYFGINSTNDLPKIREVLAEQIIEGTIINPEDFVSHEGAIVETPTNEMDVPTNMEDVEMNDGDVTLDSQAEAEEQEALREADEAEAAEALANQNAENVTAENEASVDAEDEKENNADKDDDHTA